MSDIRRRCAVALVATMALIALFATPASAAPTASFDVSANLTSGSPVTFTSTSTAPAPFTISKVEWDLDGDGGYDDGEGATLTRTFASGTYEVGIRVTSTELIDNVDTDSKTVTVATRPPVAAFTFNPDEPDVGQPILFASNSSDPDGDALAHSWDFGDGSGPVTTRNVSHTYTTPGEKTVRLIVNDGKGGADDVTQTINIIDPSSPEAKFDFDPLSPVAGQRVTFRSASSPSVGNTIESQRWDLDSDGEFDDGTGRTATYTFDSRGVYRVALRVTQSNGKDAIAEGTVRVGEIKLTPPPRQDDPPPPDDDGAPVARPSMLSPFPIVKIAGLAYARRTRITKIAVVTPRGSVASVKCVGKRACPDATRRKRARPKHTRLRFKTFERYLPAGARLIVVIHKKNRIGKYVSVKLRRSKEPLRVDRCVNPGKKKPRPCPSA